MVLNLKFMKIINEQEFKKMSKEEQEEHHRKVREDMIKLGLIKPEETL